MYIYILAHEVKLTWMCNADLRKRGLGGDHVLSRVKSSYKTHIRLSGHTLNMTS